MDDISFSKRRKNRGYTYRCAGSPSASATIFHLCMLFDSCLTLVIVVLLVMLDDIDDISFSKRRYFLIVSWMSISVYCIPTRDTHITRDMCMGIHISRGYTYHCDTGFKLNATIMYSSSAVTFFIAFLYLVTAGLGEGFEMRWCTISAEETSKCNDFKHAINIVALKGKVSVDFSCVQGSKAVDCMEKIKSGKADLITLDGGEIFTAGKKYEMVPIVGEDYKSGTPTTSYFAVAVARKNSSLTFKTLKGKKSCHTGAGKTSGWNVPVGLLLSKNIMQTNESCNAYTAAGAFFSESCVPNVKTSTYDPKGTNPDNLCALCTDECSKNGNYSGYSGAFKCLKDGVGDVAFVKHTTVPSAEASSYVYLCKDGTTKDTYENCYLAKVPSHAVMVKKGNANNANYKQLLLYASKVAGINQTDPTQFQLFNSSKYKGKDLLFKDSTKQLVDVKDKNTYEKWLGTDYLEDLKALKACQTTPRPTAGGKNNMLELLSAMISFITLFYTGALFK